MTEPRPPQSRPDPTDQEDLQRRIETLVAEADLKNLRQTSRQLEQLVRMVSDPVTRRQYEAVIDQLPTMVAHSQDKD